MPKRKSSSKKRRSKKQAKQPSSLIRGFKLLVLLSAAFFCGCVYLALSWQHQVIEQFSGRKWQVPTKVYARPLELYSQADVSAERVIKELELLRYQKAARTSQLKPGTYQQRSPYELRLHTRGFDFWDSKESAQALTLTFSRNQLSQILNTNQAPIGIARLEPVLIGGIFPDHKEDRVLIQLEKTPPLLVHGLLLIEDRDFYKHSGLSLKSISRALVSNLKAGHVVQGGSTITQQLVKNFFLTQERTFSRKFKEAIFTLILEQHFSKNEILEAYLNEVYLGQDGPRAIHGFGLATQHYFGKSPNELLPHEIALLVALIKGPSYYHPGRNRERAINRRNLVLEQLHLHQLITKADYEMALSRPLSVLKNHHYSANRYPAFLDLVQRQLKDDYPKEALTSEGLRVFTTLDPNVQATTESAMHKVVKQLNETDADTAIEGAAIVTHAQSGEVLAVVGSASARTSGFNRALDAYRPVGSIIKPAVYLAALESTPPYQLNSRIEDSPITITTQTGEEWSPENFSRSSHGSVFLQTALASSYNQATTRLGMTLGLHQTTAMLKKLGLKKDILEVPALLLGSIDLSPLEVAGLYQTIAADGFNVPIRSIQAVQQADGTLLNQYPLKVAQQISPTAIMLIKHALQQVVEQGTAQSLKNRFGSNSGLAGKTGTTNDLRDSWFAGMSKNRLGVVWLGRDNNQPTQLTGATGALRVWSEVMAPLNPQPVFNPITEDYQKVWLDSENGFPTSSKCPTAVEVILPTHLIPSERSRCTPPGRSSFFERWRRSSY